MTSLEKPGIITSKAEVSNISANGIWLICGDREYFLPAAYRGLGRARCH